MDSRKKAQKVKTQSDEPTQVAAADCTITTYMYYHYRYTIDIIFDCKMDLFIQASFYMFISHGEMLIYSHLNTHTTRDVLSQVYISLVGSCTLTCVVLDLNRRQGGILRGDHRQSDPLPGTDRQSKYQGGSTKRDHGGSHPTSSGNTCPACFPFRSTACRQASAERHADRSFIHIPLCAVIHYNSTGISNPQGHGLLFVYIHHLWIASKHLIN